MIAKLAAAFESPVSINRTHGLCWDVKPGFRDCCFVSLIMPDRQT
jgi:hypothetical protein